MNRHNPTLLFGHSCEHKSPVAALSVGLLEQQILTCSPFSLHYLITPLADTSLDPPVSIFNFQASVHSVIIFCCIGALIRLKLATL